MTQTTAQTFKIIGVTDETTVCEHCGKTNLKKVVVLENLETGEIVRYGTDCAAKAMKTAKKTVDYEFEMISMIKRWVANLGVEKTLIALSNRGYGAQFRNGQITVRGVTTPIII